MGKFGGGRFLEKGGGGRVFWKKMLGLENYVTFIVFVTTVLKFHGSLLVQLIVSMVIVNGNCNGKIYKSYLNQCSFIKIFRTTDQV